MKKNSTLHKKKEIRFLSKQINLEYKELKEAQKKENGQVLQIVEDMESRVTSTEILNSTPNDTVSLNCSGLVRKVSVGEPIQLERPAV